VSSKPETLLHLTQRALHDFASIRAYSTEQWGRRIAEKYFDEIETGLVRLKGHPDLLRENSDYDSALRFYRVNKHVLVCDVQPNSIVVLTVIHASMDLPSRLSELQPTLAAEVQILHQTLHEKKKLKSRR